MSSPKPVTNPPNALLQRAHELGEQFPNSYIVLDAATLELLGKGADPDKLMERIAAQLQDGQIPFVYKKPQKGRILIL